ncbi:MAG: sigma-70 family RNA polymerase sigma factor, partial [Gemmataceae bacterium]
MAKRSDPLLRHLRRLVSKQETEADAVLLHRYVHFGDEDAFAELLKRHAAMVLSVCRRLLHDEHHAEDAAQATFLVLAGKAATVRPASSLSAWLHSVARHLALKCRRGEERRRLREAQSVADAAASRQRDPLDELTARELLGIVDEEIQHLPEKYRVPLILCALEGLSVEAAALRLESSPGSVRGRLARARARLHARLSRRGVVLPAVTISALIAPKIGQAALLSLRARAGVSARVAALAQEGLKIMSWSKLKIGLALLLTAAVAAGAGGLASYRTPPKEQPAQKSQAEKKPANESARNPLSDRRTQAGRDCYGDPLPVGARVRLGTVRLRHRGPITAVAYSPDGSLLASSGWDEVIHLWDANTGQSIRELTEPRRTINLAIAFSPDGTKLASTGETGNVRLWDVKSGRKLMDAKGH